MSLASIDKFKSSFKHGFVHPNLFRIQFTGGPAFLHKDGVNEMMSLACKSAQIPGTTFPEEKYYHNGRYMKFVNGADYDPFTMVFLVDDTDKLGGSKIISVMDDWNAAIYDYEKGKFGFKNDYKADLIISMFNRAGTMIYQSKLLGVYPVNITSFDLSYDTKTTIMDYEVSFNFDQFG